MWVRVKLRLMRDGLAPPDLRHLNVGRQGLEPCPPDGLFRLFKGVQPNTSDMRFDLRFHVSERPFVKACSSVLKAVEVYGHVYSGIL
jgi:hypothetical protein